LVLHFAVESPSLRRMIALCMLDRGAESAEMLAWAAVMAEAKYVL
jgi:hypothetical protein